MRLKNPPLIEAWMSFRFLHGASQHRWTKLRYLQFLETLTETHPEIEYLSRSPVEQNSSLAGRKTIRRLREEILAMRALSSDGLRAVHLISDQLIVNYVRGKEDYPGFSKLLEEAMALAKKYSSVYSPMGVAEVALHYVDLVPLPKNEHKYVCTEDYFTVDFRVPSEFGTFSGFDIRTVVRPAPHRLPVQMFFSSETSAPEDSVQNFRIEWHVSKGSMSVMAEEEMLANLNEAHECLTKCFRSMFTPKGWALLQPEN